MTEKCQAPPRSIFSLANQLVIFFTEKETTFHTPPRSQKMNHQMTTQANVELLQEPITYSDYYFAVVLARCQVLFFIWKTKTEILIASLPGSIL